MAARSLERQSAVRAIGQADVARDRGWRGVLAHTPRRVPTWGATEDEAHCHLPGDELLEDADVIGYGTNRTLLIIHSVPAARTPVTLRWVSPVTPKHGDGCWVCGCPPGHGCRVPTRCELARLSSQVRRGLIAESQRLRGSLW